MSQARESRNRGIPNQMCSCRDVQVRRRDFVDCRRAAGAVVIALVLLCAAGRSRSGYHMPPLSAEGEAIQRARQADQKAPQTRVI
jgi:hypothetical protein